MPYGSTQGARRDGGEGNTVHEVVQEAKRFAFSSSSCVIPLRLFSGLAAINPHRAWLQCPSICGPLCRLSHLTIPQYWWLSFNSEPGNSKLYEFFQITVFFSSPDLSVVWWSLTWPPSVLPAVIWPHLCLKHHSAKPKHNSGAMKAYFMGLPLSYLSLWNPADLLEAENISRCNVSSFDLGLFHTSRRHWAAWGRSKWQVPVLATTNWFNWWI